MDTYIKKQGEQKNERDLIPDNPDLVDELIDGAMTMDSEEFDRKYSSLNSSDMCKVAAATITMDYFMMDDRFVSSFEDEDFDGFTDLDDLEEYDDEYGEYDE